MRLPRFVLGSLVAVGLFALAGSTAQAQHRHGCYAPPVYRTYRPVVVAPPVVGFGVPTYGYSRGTSFSFGYSSGGFYNGYNRGYYPGYYGRSYYGARPGISFGFTTFR